METDFATIRSQARKEVSREMGIHFSRHGKSWSIDRFILDRFFKHNINPGKHNIYHTPWSLK